MRPPPGGPLRFRADLLCPARLRFFALRAHGQEKMGELLARDDDVKADIVISVPDSGNSAALGYSAASGVPLENGLTRNHYSGGRSSSRPQPAGSSACA